MCSCTSNLISSAFCRGLSTSPSSVLVSWWWLEATINQLAALQLALCSGHSKAHQITLHLSLSLLSNNWLELTLPEWSKWCVRILQKSIVMQRPCQPPQEEKNNNKAMLRKIIMTVGSISGYEKQKSTIPHCQMPLQADRLDFLTLHALRVIWPHRQNCQKSGQNPPLKGCMQGLP